MRRFQTTLATGLLLAGCLLPGPVQSALLPERAMAAGVYARASISSASPAQYSTVTVYGRLYAHGRGVPGLRMTTAWHYRTTISHCSGRADRAGLAECSRRISRATGGYAVRVVVRFRYHGQTYRATTRFTPH